jgi:hypothetical protein
MPFRRFNVMAGDFCTVIFTFVCVYTMSEVKIKIADKFVDTFVHSLTLTF